MTKESGKHTDFEALKKDPPGAVYVDEFDEGVRFLILRGPASLCAYIGIPLEHPLAGQDYDNLPISAHGGLTYSGEGVKGAPDGYWWYGWDYGHSGDVSMYERAFEWEKDAKKWTVQEVKKDSLSAIYDFKKLVKLAEVISAKKKSGFRLTVKVKSKATPHPGE